MNGAGDVLVVCCLGAVQVLGLLSAAVARLSEGSRCQAPGQWAFLALLAIVGCVTVVSLALGSGFWLPSGATLSLMILGAVCDFRGSLRASVR
jgi:hypothetical protein